MKVLLLSAYHAQSHDYWLRGLQRSFPEFDWTVLTLPPRYFSWRIRGNSLSWAFLNRETLIQDYDLLIATSMCDLSSLRGFVPQIARIPTLVYCHENQFAYPDNPQQQGQLEAQMLNLYTALCADQLVFNSHFNRSSFLSGVRTLLQKMPDFAPVQPIIERLSEGRVVPVGIDNAAGTGHGSKPLKRDKADRLWLVWNHRWEYDKGPARLLEVLRACDLRGLTLDLSVIGQQFRRQPAEFSALKACVESSRSLRLRHWGFIEDRKQYRGILAQADVVLSTALHDFQGLSVLEAVAAGCLPLVPDQLAYPEWFDQSCLYGSDDDCVAQLDQRLALKREGVWPCAPDISKLSWEALTGEYRSLFEATAERGGSLR